MKRLKVVMSVEDGLSVKNGPKGKKEHLARKGFRKLVNIEEGFCKDFTRFSQGLIKLVYIEGKKYFPPFSLSSSYGIKS